MEVLSWQFLLFFLAAFSILFFKLRKKKVHTSVPRKTISIQGKRLRTPISVETPLPCLLEDDLSFGEDYRNKREPALPHAKGCRCVLSEFRRSSGDCFAKSSPAESGRDADPGSLSHDERRYFKYRLIANHRDASAKQREEYGELSERIAVDSEFKKRVSDMMAAAQREGEGDSSNSA